MVVYLDTETTGLSASGGHTIVEIAIVDGNGRPLMNTLVDPQRPISPIATSIHGITDAMVRSQPTLKELLPEIRTAIRGKELVIYNATFDLSFFPKRLTNESDVRCAMREFATIRGTRWSKLADAAAHVGHRWSGVAHRALADALACRSVWNWIRRRS